MKFRLKAGCTIASVIFFFNVGFSEEQNAVTAGSADTRLRGAGQATKAAPGCQKESVPEQRPFT